MKKVIEQGKGYLDIQHLTKTISVYQRFGLNPNGVLILIDKPKAREVALAIYPELESELAEKDKVIERFAIGFAKWIRENGYGYSKKFNLYQKSLINETIFFYEKDLIELYKQSLNK